MTDMNLSSSASCDPASSVHVDAEWVPIVPNGTAVSMMVLDDKVTNLSVEAYVERYRGLFFRSAAFYVHAAYTVVHAKHNLRPREFTRFCDAVNLDPQSSSFRKVETIGQNFTRLEPVLDKVPNKWTTIYRLAHIGVDQFERVLQSGRMNPHMTDKDLSAILDVKPKEKKAAKRDVVLDLSKLGDGEKQTFITELLALKSRFGFTVTGVAINEESGQ